MEDVTPRPSETQTSANSHLSPAHALHMGSDHVSQARRIRRREKLALKGYGAFMYAQNQFYPNCPANAGRDGCGLDIHCFFSLLLRYFALISNASSFLLLIFLGPRCRAPPSPPPAPPPSQTNFTTPQDPRWDHQLSQTLLCWERTGDYGLLLAR